jgi:hypothetical protein
MRITLEAPVVIKALTDATIHEELAEDAEGEFGETPITFAIRKQ